MYKKFLLREWIGIAIILGAILTTFIVTKISEKRVYKILKSVNADTLPLQAKK